MKICELINEVMSGLEGEIFPSSAYVLEEYNRAVRSLFLILPSADASITLTPSDGKLQTELSPAQVRRIFAGESELLCVSKALTALMPEAKLYYAGEDGIFVTTTGECTVYYRSLPDAVTEVQAESTDIPLDERHIPLIRAWLYRSVFLYVGDFESADAYGEEYNRLLEDYKTENGVAM